MGVNVIEKSIRDEEVVTQACLEEISRRMNRYKDEIARGHESSETLLRTVSYGTHHDDVSEAS